jgi:hypothetical protein
MTEQRYLVWSSLYTSVVMLGCAPERGFRLAGLAMVGGSLVLVALTYLS